MQVDGAISRLMVAEVSKSPCWLGKEGKEGNLLSKSSSLGPVIMGEKPKDADF